MNGSARAVLWIGLVLIALNIAMKWSTVRDTIFTGGSDTGPGSSNSSGGKRGITIPLIPGLPGNIPQPHLTVPISAQAGNKNPSGVTLV